MFKELQRKELGVVDHVNMNTCLVFVSNLSSLFELFFKLIQHEICRLRQTAPATCSSRVVLAYTCYSHVYHVCRSRANRSAAKEQEVVSSRALAKNMNICYVSTTAG